MKNALLVTLLSATAVLSSTSAMAQIVQPEPSFGVSPIEVGGANKAQLFNDKMDAMGFNARIEIDKDMNAVLRTDGNDFMLTGASDAQLAVMKNAATVAIKQQVVGVKPIKEPIVVDPIKGEKPVKAPLDNVVAGLQKKADELRSEYTGQRGKQFKQEFNDFKFETQADIADLYNEVDRLDEKMDGVMAGTHAINNARPFLTGAGQTAVGVGVGYAGDSSAVAIGAAHSVNANWSVSLTVNATTGSESEVSGGVGTQYIF